MPIIDIQRRLRELGRIRIGQVVTTKSGKTAPSKLDRFRFTSANRPLLEQIAGHYGGEVRDWQPQGNGAAGFEVITDATEVPVIVPPGQPVSQWYEAWTGGGCQRRCDGATEILSDQPCICATQDERICKPTTRLNVMLRDVDVIGVFRLETHGWNAATELPAAAELCIQAAAALGHPVPAVLELQERVDKKDGQTRRYMVPGLVPGVSPAALIGVTGSAPALAKQERPAIESGGVPDFLAEAKAATSLEEWREVYTRASNSGAPWTMQLKADLIAIGEQFKTATQPAGAPELDPDVVWQQILAVAGEKEMTIPEIEDDFAQRNGGVTTASASGPELGAYLEHLWSES